MRTLTLIRGLPGSGKSTLAKLMVAGYRDVEGTEIATARHFEADMYMVEADGKYCFDPERLPEVHAKCRLHARQEMEFGREHVIVSNTFTTIGEMQPYLDAAERYDYTVQVIDCHGTFGSVHNVPEEVIERMRARWETYKGEP